MFTIPWRKLLLSKRWASVPGMWNRSKNNRVLGEVIYQQSLRLPDLRTKIISFTLCFLTINLTEASQDLQSVELFRGNHKLVLPPVYMYMIWNIKYVQEILVDIEENIKSSHQKWVAKLWLYSLPTRYPLPSYFLLTVPILWWALLRVPPADATFTFPACLAGKDGHVIESWPKSPTWESAVGQEARGWGLWECFDVF